MNDREKGTEHGKLTEAEIRAVMDGDDYAIRKMYDCYRGLARALCQKRGISWGYVFNDAEVEDMVQDVWTKLITDHLKSFTRLD